MKEGVSRDYASDERKFYEIWRLYDFSKKGAYVLRSGFYIAGVVPAPESAKMDFFYRGDDDAHHQYGAETLLDGIYLWYPELFPAGVDMVNLLRVMRTHDVGETVIGDWPNDGTQDKAKKRRLERVVVADYASHMPLEAQTEYMTYYDGFETEAFEADEMYAVIGFCDKFEALFQLLRYERDGHVGCYDALGVYNGKETSRERAAKAVTGTDNPTDNWAHRIYMSYEGVERGGRVGEFFRILVGIHAVGVLEVRGEPFRWLPKEFYDYWGISLEAIREVIDE